MSNFDTTNLIINFNKKIGNEGVYYVTGVSGITGPPGSIGSTGPTGSEGRPGIGLIGPTGPAGSGTGIGSGADGISGTGTGVISVTGSIPRFTGTGTIGNSSIIQGSSAINTTYILIDGALGVGGNLDATRISQLQTRGAIRATNDILAFQNSDRRFKQNITGLTGSLDKLFQINGYEFDWIPMPEFHPNIGHDVGVIAQEIEKVMPDIITTRDNGYLAIKYDRIIPYLIEAIKELSVQVKILQDKSKVGPDCP